MNFRELFIQMRGMKHYFIAAAGTLALGIYLGFTHPEQFYSMLNAQNDQMKGIQDRISGSNHQQLQLFLEILRNNVEAILVVLYAGILFALPPLLVLISNGMFLGYVAHTQVPDTGWFSFLSQLVPHSIVEIPAVILACAYGMKLGLLTIESMITFPSAKRRALNGPRYVRFLKLTLPLCICLLVMLVVAAVIESTVSYSLAS